MASPFFPMFSNFPSSSLLSTPVTKEEFNAFHRIDRSLFKSLVIDLNRDINQSYQVIGFLLFLEQNGYARDLISYLVVSLSLASINAVAKEIVVCLRFLYNKDFFSSMIFGGNNNYDQSVIPLIVGLTGGRLSLNVINEKRESFLIGLRKNISQICNRAFEDLCEEAERFKKERNLALEREKAIDEFKKIRVSAQQATSSRVRGPQATTYRPYVQPVWVPTTPPPAKQEPNKTEEEVAPDDRTVFLTFSKGYPISEEQVRVYFTRKFGEVIEAVEMQEVEEFEQPLYARMVLKMRYVSKMEEIVCGRNRNKYTIDGKHVWAHKYVRQTLASAASPSSSHT